MLLEINQLSRRIAEPGGATRPVLDRVDLNVAAGECVALVGRSGAGKTTLLHLIAGLDRAEGGSIRFEGRDIAAISAAELAQLRRRRMGLVFQNNLSLSALPVWENAALPLLLEGAHKKRAQHEAEAWLERVGLAGYARAATSALSGGQRRRLGLARALIARPTLLLADEPTSDLDDATAGEIEALMFGFLKEIGAAALIVTHSESIERAAGRVVRLEAGKIKE